MGQILHGSATTTHAIRAVIQRSKAPLKELAARYGLNRKTVAKWRKLPGGRPDGPQGALLNGAGRGAIPTILDGEKIRVGRKAVVEGVRLFV